MKILHVYPKSDEMVAQHVAQLMDGMQLSAEVQAVSNLADFKIICKNFNPDIVHCHGCWQFRPQTRHPDCALASWTIRALGARRKTSPREIPQDRPLAKALCRKGLCTNCLWQDGTSLSGAIAMESPH